MDERKAGVTTASWQIVSPSFYPSEAAIQAAERDVVQPWTAGTKTTVRRSVAKSRTWWVPLSTPLDGSLTVTATLPRGGLHEVALVGANRRTVLKRAIPSGARFRSINATVCGQRSLFVRVTQKGKTGVVTVGAAKP